MPKRNPKPLQIGPVLSVYERGYVPNMQDAYNTDFEMGSPGMSEEASNHFFDRYKTIVSMAQLIEQERNKLRGQVRALRQELRVARNAMGCVLAGVEKEVPGYPPMGKSSRDTLAWAKDRADRALGKKARRA